MRGAVSLAAALALPHDFPQRDLLVFLAFCVILVTLIGQGLTLAPAHPGAAHRARQRDAARRRTSPAGRPSRRRSTELERARDTWPQHLPLIDRLVETYEHRVEHIGGDGDEVSESDQERLEHRAILGSVLSAERRAVIEMRDRGMIADQMLRKIERELDLEELRLSAEA